MNNVCVVIATYNEAGSIEEVLQGLTDYDVIVVDDSSPDDTAALCRKFSNVTVISRPPKSGIASAYITGFKAALAANKYDYVVQMDAGLTHQPADVKRLLREANDAAADLVIGSRGISSRTIRHWRTALSRIAVFAMRLLGLEQQDVTSGFRCWKTTLLRRLWFANVQSRGFAFQLELLYNAVFLKAKIIEIPIDYRLTSSSLNRKILFEAIWRWHSMWCQRYTHYDFEFKKHYESEG